MLVNLIEISPEAYPLLVNHLLHHPQVHSPDQEIVYRDLRRRTYRKFREPLGVPRCRDRWHRRRWNEASTCSPAMSNLRRALC